MQSGAQTPAGPPTDSPSPPALAATEGLIPPVADSDGPAAPTLAGKSIKANAWLVNVNANTEVVRTSAMAEAILIVDEFVCIYSSITILYYQ